MTLTLRLLDVSYLDNGMPTEFVLSRRGAIIGRSPTCDWSLPDANKHISSRHCEIRYEGGDYLLVDTSTNGTFLNNSTERMNGPHRIVDGDRIAIGPFHVAAQVHGGAASSGAGSHAGASAGSATPESDPNWGGWEAHGGTRPAPPPPPTPNGWDALGDDGWGSRASITPPPTPAPAPPPPSGDGWGAAPAPAARDNGWAASSAPAQPTAPVESPWAQPEAARPAPSAWSSAAPDRAPAPSPDDLWGRIADGHVVDWARAGFAQDDLAEHRGLGVGGGRPAAAAPTASAPTSDMANWAAPALPRGSTPPDNDGWGAPSAPAPPPPAAGDDWRTPAATPAPAPGARPAADPPSPPRTPPAPTGSAPLDAFLRGANLPRDAGNAAPAEMLERAGETLRRLVAGLVVLVEARARAKSQMGAEATSFGFDGNNPLKFARSPEQALEQLINPPVRGFMDAPAAISDAFEDLQSHQMATLKAMQGALRATLDRFSPTAIRSRAEAGGILTRILPGGRDAALWQAYEREFGGVKQGSDEAFMDVFAREFRRAYEEQARAGSDRRGR